MRLANLALGFFLGAIVFIGASLVLAWTGPTSPPPAGNVAAPLNVGTTDQIKNAGLGLNSLAVFGNAIISGTSRYLNFGSTAGSSGYGFRDNAGTMEFKDSGSSWQSLTTAIQSFFAVGNTVSQIKFADGTTQTSAASGGTPSGTVGGGCTGAAEQPQSEGEEQPPPGDSGWGNALNCSTASVCNNTTISGTCPAGYTERRIGAGSMQCSGAKGDGSNCGCGGHYQWSFGMSYYPSYYPAPMLCVKD